MALVLGKILAMGLTAAAGLPGRKRVSAETEVAEWLGIACVVTCQPAAAMRFPRRNTQFRC